MITRFFYFLALLILLIVLPSLALSNEPKPSEPIKVSVGLKYWTASWEEPEDQLIFVEDVGVVQLDAEHGSGHWAGPNISFRSGKFGFNFSYMGSVKKYKQTSLGDEIFDFSRKDISSTLSYQIKAKPNIALFVGLKGIFYKFENAEIDFSKDISEIGFGGGIAVSRSLGKGGAFIYSSMAFIKVGGEIDSVWDMYELGIGLRPQKSRVTGTIGYRLEGAEMKGLTAGLSAAL